MANETFFKHLAPAAPVTAVAASAAAPAAVMPKKASLKGGRKTPKSPGRRSPSPRKKSPGKEKKKKKKAEADFFDPTAQPPSPAVRRVQSRMQLGDDDHAGALIFQNPPAVASVVEFVNRGKLGK